MPKDVDLTKKSPPPVSSTKQEELRARATGNSGKLIPVPPSAKALPPGVTGQKPLPEGKAVGMIAPSSMTETERATMEAVGWTEDIPIPAHMAKILEEEVKKRGSEEVTLPLDPRTPAFKQPETKKLSELSREEQASILEAMKQAAEAQQLQQKAAAQSQEDSDKQQKLRQNVKGMDAALQAAAQAKSYTQQRQRASLDVVDDRDDPALSYPQTDSGQMAAADKARYVESKRAEDDAEVRKAEKVVAANAALLEKAAAEKANDTGANLTPAFCPHCQWDLGIPDIPEPPYADKMSFVHAILGRKCWIKEYELFGGVVLITFRTLTPREIDAVYKQTYADLNAGKFSTDVDFWERVNRYRLFLQIQQFRSSSTKRGESFIHDLPDGLTKEANPAGTGFWWKEEDDTLLGVNETPLLRVEEHIVTEVFKTEAVFRVVNNACNQFNRLVAKMEAMADNSDFWQPTGAQS